MRCQTTSALVPCDGAVHASPAFVALYAVGVAPLHAASLSLDEQIDAVFAHVSGEPSAVRRCVGATGAAATATLAAHGGGSLVAVWLTLDDARDFAAANARYAAHVARPPPAR